MKTDNVAPRSTASCGRYSSHLVKTKNTFRFYFRFRQRKRHRCLVKTNIGITWTAELLWPPEGSFNDYVTLFAQFPPFLSFVMKCHTRLPSSPHIASQYCWGPPLFPRKRRITVTTSTRIQSCTTAINANSQISHKNIRVERQELKSCSLLILS